MALISHRSMNGHHDSAHCFNHVELFKPWQDPDGDNSPLTFKLIESKLRLGISDGFIRIHFKHNRSDIKISMARYDCLPISKTFMVFNLKEESTVLNNVDPSIELFSGCFGFKFKTSNDFSAFYEALKKSRNCDEVSSNNSSSVNGISDKLAPLKRKRIESDFDQRTEESSAQAYFQFYALLSQQQNMMQDYSRTSTYQRAIHENSIDFRDKVIMDVGAGSGILSFFAIQAGAKRVYAIEASSMADHCRVLVKSNGLEGKIKVIAEKVENIEMPELVDLIVSEPMGYMLVNERMLESFVYARKFLKPGGRMFPTKAELRIALFNDEAVYLEQTSKCAFWQQDAFHGVNLSALKQDAVTEAFSQPIVDSWYPSILVSKTITWCINFETDDLEKLQNIEIPLNFTVFRTAYIHGIATWFDVAFCGSKRKVWLSTAPSEPLTHWYQVRCLLQQPVLATHGQEVSGLLKLIANDKQSYNIHLQIKVNDQTYTNSLDLKQPYFRYTGQFVMPPGSSTENPSETLDKELQVQSQQLQENDQLEETHTLVTSGIGSFSSYQSQLDALAMANGLYVAQDFPSES